MLQLKAHKALRPYLAQKTLKWRDLGLLIQFAAEANFNGVIHTSLQALAKELGMNPCTASVCLKRLKEHDLMRVGRIGNGGRFYMVNPSLLYAGAEMKPVIARYLQLEGPSSPQRVKSIAPVRRAAQRAS